MSFADCNACVRHHRRPVNTKCEYVKAAVEKCLSLRLKSSDYMLHLPDLLPEDIDPKMAGNQTKVGAESAPLVQEAGNINNDLIARLVEESVESRRLLESSQGQVERMMAQLLDLKIEHSRSKQPITSEKPVQINSTPPGFFPIGINPSSTSKIVPNVSKESSSIPVPGSTATSGGSPQSGWPGYTRPPWQPGAPWTSTPSAPGASWVPAPGAGSAQQAGSVQSTAVPNVFGASASPTGAVATGFGVHGVPINPYLPPYLLPGASQQTSVQVPYRCETDHLHPPRQTCTTAKRKLQIYDLEVHMRYASSTTTTLEDVIAASLSLMESMLRQGVDCTGYVRHIRFLVEKSKVYSSSSLIGYDAELRERAEFYGSSVFSYGDHDLTHRWLGVEALKSSVSSTHSVQNQSGSKRKARSNRFGSCWGWNDNKPCKALPCKYKHCCSNCQGDHKQVDCPTKVSLTVTPKVNK